MSAQFDKLADGERIELFREIGSQDFLHFNFGRSYEKQIEEAVAKTGKFCAITVHLRVLKVISNNGSFSYFNKNISKKLN